MALWSPVLRPCRKVRARAWGGALRADPGAVQAGRCDGRWLGPRGGMGMLCDELADGTCWPPRGHSKGLHQMVQRPKSLTVWTIYKIEFHRLKALAEKTRVQKQ